MIEGLPNTDLPQTMIGQYFIFLALQVPQDFVRFSELLGMILSSQQGLFEILNRNV